MKVEYIPTVRATSSAPATATRRGAFTLTVDHVWLVGTLVFAFLTGTLLSAEQPDYWWTVKLGERLWATHQLPTADSLVFTWSRGTYIEQQWLAQLILAAVHHLGGLEAALLLRAILLVLTAALLYQAARHRGALPAAATAATMLALLSLVGGSAIRPQLLAIPLCTVFLVGTTVWAERGWTLVALPAAMVIWANVHGSFILGIVLVAIALAGRAAALAQPTARPGAMAQRLAGDRLCRRFALLLGVCTLAALINPYGPGIVSYLADYMTYSTGGQGLPTLATEWLPTSLGTAHGTLFFISAFLVLAVLIRLGLDRFDDGLRLTVFALLALQAVRNTLWWALVMAPVLAWGLTAVARGRGRQRAESRPSPKGRAARPVGVPALNAVLIGAFIGVAALSWPGLRPYGLLFTPERWPIAGPDLPVAAADYVATLPATRFYNYMDWGGYLGWRLAPRQRIFVRFNFSPPQFYRDYFTIANAAPGWSELLVAYGADGLIVSRADQPALLRALAATDAWQAVYCDAHVAVFLPPATAPGPAVACDAE